MKDMSNTNPLQYSAKLISLLSLLLERDEHYPLGDGYDMRVYQDYDGANWWEIYRYGEIITTGSSWLSIDGSDNRDDIHTAVSLLYAKRDDIMARILEDLEVARPSAEAQLARESTHGAAN